MHRNRVVLTAAGAAVCLLIPACGGSTQVSSSTVTTVPATVESTAVTTTPPTTVPPTTVAPETTAPPTSPPPTSPPATTAPATTPTTAPASPPAAKPATAFATADEQLVEVDAVSGATTRVLDEFFSGDGVFRGGIRLSPDRTTIWFSEGFEDSWYACDTSIGSFGRVDVATGAIEVIGTGSGVEPSPDGEFVAYLSSTVCLPDPENPEFFVLTPNDHVVVRQIATGEERSFFTDAPPDSYGAPGAVLGAGFSPGGNLLVLLGDGRLINVDVNGSGVIQEHPVALAEVTGSPVAATADALITVDFGDEGSSDVYSVDPASGAPTLLASSGAYMGVGVSADGHVVVTSFEPVTVAPGSDVTIIDLPGDAFVFDLDW